MRFSVLKTDIACIFCLFLFLVCPDYMPAASESENIPANQSIAPGRAPSKIVWRKKSSLPEAEFLQLIREDAKQGAKMLGLSNAPEWKDPIARELHLVATQRGIKDWTYRWYIWFAAGAKKQNDANPTDVYKIHLMPYDHDLVSLAYLLSGIIQEDPDLYNNIISYKFHLLRHTSSYETPRVVIYINGKETAQKVLNILFTKLADIPGSRYPARYSAYVTDLIWVAQSHSEYKRDPSKKDNYEEPYLIYYRNDITGKKEDYHLKHPATGKDLNSPFAPR